MASSQLDPMLDIVKVNIANKSPIHFQEVLRSIVFSHYAAHGNLTQQKRDDNHASLNLLVARDKGLTSEGMRRSIILYEISIGRVSRRLLFDGLMAILNS